MSVMDGDWETLWRPASPPLRPYVAGYLAYRQTGAAPGTHRGLPSPYLTMIVAVDDPLTMLAHADPAQAGGDFWTLVGGLHARPALIGHPGRQAGVQIALRPLGLRSLLGLPAGELFERDVTGDTVFGRLAAELHERVHDVSTWERRIAAIDLVLSRALRPAPDVRPEVAWAWREIMRTGGAVRVADLAAEVGLSTRYLDTTMRRETGLSPKLAARVVRFDRATRLLVSGPGRLADVAAECGYFDQAHLARDFRELAGCSPSRWLAEEFRFVQVDEDSASAE